MSNINIGMQDGERERFNRWINSLPNLSGAERNALENNFNADGLQASQNIYQQHYSPEVKGQAARARQAEAQRVSDSQATRGTQTVQNTYVDPNAGRETPPVQQPVQQPYVNPNAGRETPPVQQPYVNPNAGRETPPVQKPYVNPNAERETQPVQQPYVNPNAGRETPPAQQPYVNPNAGRETPPTTPAYDESLQADRDETSRYRADLDQSRRADQAQTTQYRADLDQSRRADQAATDVYRNAQAERENTRAAEVVAYRNAQEERNRANQNDQANRLDQMQSGFDQSRRSDQDATNQYRADQAERYNARQADTSQRFLDQSGRMDQMQTGFDQSRRADQGATTAYRNEQEDRRRAEQASTDAYRNEQEERRRIAEETQAGATSAYRNEQEERRLSDQAATAAYRNEQEERRRTDQGAQADETAAYRNAQEDRYRSGQDETTAYRNEQEERRRIDEERRAGETTAYRNAQEERRQADEAATAAYRNEQEARFEELKRREEAQPENPQLNRDTEVRKKRWVNPINSETPDEAPWVNPNEERLTSDAPSEYYHASTPRIPDDGAPPVKEVDEPVFGSQLNRDTEVRNQPPASDGSGLPEWMKQGDRPDQSLVNPAGNQGDRPDQVTPQWVNPNAGRETPPAQTDPWANPNAERETPSVQKPYVNPNAGRETPPVQNEYVNPNAGRETVQQPYVNPNLTRVTPEVAPWEDPNQGRWDRNYNEDRRPEQPMNPQLNRDTKVREKWETPDLFQGNRPDQDPPGSVPPQTSDYGDQGTRLDQDPVGSAPPQTPEESRAAYIERLQAGRPDQDPVGSIPPENSGTDSFLPPDAEFYGREKKTGIEGEIEELTKNINIDADAEVRRQQAVAENQFQTQREKLARMFAISPGSRGRNLSGDQQRDFEQLSAAEANAMATIDAQVRGQAREEARTNIATLLGIQTDIQRGDIATRGADVSEAEVFGADASGKTTLAERTSERSLSLEEKKQQYLETAGDRGQTLDEAIQAWQQEQGERALTVQETQAEHDIYTSKRQQELEEQKQDYFETASNRGQTLEEAIQTWAEETQGRSLSIEEQRAEHETFLAYREQRLAEKEQAYGEESRDRALKLEEDKQEYFETASNRGQTQEEAEFEWESTVRFEREQDYREEEGRAATEIAKSAQQFSEEEGRSRIGLASAEVFGGSKGLTMNSLGIDPSSIQEGDKGKFDSAFSTQFGREPTRQESEDFLSGKEVGARKTFQQDQFDQTFAESTRQWNDAFLGEMLDENGNVREGLDSVRVNAQVSQFKSEMANAERALTANIAQSWASITGDTGSGMVTLTDVTGMSVEKMQAAINDGSMTNEQARDSIKSGFKAMMNREPTMDELQGLYQGGLEVEGAPTLEAKRLASTISQGNLDRSVAYKNIASQEGLDYAKIAQIDKEADREWERLTLDISSQIGVDKGTWQGAVFEYERAVRGYEIEEIVDGKKQMVRHEAMSPEKAMQKAHHATLDEDGAHRMTIGEINRGISIWQRDFGASNDQLRRSFDMQEDQMARTLDALSRQEERENAVWNGMLGTKRVTIKGGEFQRSLVQGGGIEDRKKQVDTILREAVTPDMHDKFPGIQITPEEMESFLAGTGGNFTYSDFAEKEGESVYDESTGLVVPVTRTMGIGILGLDPNEVQRDYDVRTAEQIMEEFNRLPEDGEQRERWVRQEAENRWNITLDNEEIQNIIENRNVVIQPAPRDLLKRFKDHEQLNAFTSWVTGAAPFTEDKGIWDAIGSFAGSAAMGFISGGSSALGAKAIDKLK